VRRRLIANLLALVACAAPLVSAASFPPGLRFRSLHAARVTVTFPDALEAQARRAAALADEILAAQERRYGTRVGRVQIVLTDVDDAPNGFATPLPYPLLHVRAAAPDGTDGFGNLESWLRLVLTHELAHLTHLNEARGVMRLGRKLFGRAPFLFPNVLTPGWMIEGLATYEETEGTAFGRGRAPRARMLRRMAALEGRQPREDQAVLALDRWPGGDAQYLFGEAFLRELSERFGDETLPRLSRGQAGRPIPFFDDLTSKEVTGASFHERWSEWRARERAGFEAEAEARRAQGLTESRALTARGVSQVGPRFSPDGAWIAYTSGTLTRYRAVRLMRADGSDDRKLAERTAGDTLAWTPDGRTLVYGEPEVERLFTTRGGLRALDVESGRARWIARGLRASAPDVAPDGWRVVCVRRHEDRSELALLDLRAGAGDARDLTASPPEIEWSAPRFSPSGDAIAAVRWRKGGFVDLVLVDASSGAVRELTRDRAVDAEPTFTPDGRHIVFRSERDGVSNLYALALDDGTLARLTNVQGGAFTPSVAPDGHSVAFASYTARGYDIHVAALDLQGAAPAAPFADAFPQPRPEPAPVDAPVRPYRPLTALRPRFWSPYVASESRETRLGAFTGGFDPLLRHAYGLLAARGNDSERVTLRGFYQYDRFRPTLLLTFEDETDPPATRLGRTRSRNLTLRATLPLQRTFRFEHSLSLAWRREHPELVDRHDRDLAERGGLEASWSLSSAKLYPYAISPGDGWGLRVAYFKEARAFGSDLSLTKLTADARAYVRLGEGDVLALRAGGGTTLGQPGFLLSYEIGGFPEGEIFDLAFTNPAVLRGYPDGVAVGRRLVYASAEYRFPLWHPQGGWRTAPVFLRHVHAALVADAAHVWSDRLRLAEVRSAAGVALGADTVVGHGLPLTATAGIARGFARDGETRAWLRLGLAF
jgi:Tol biopolymer transport system component